LAVASSALVDGADGANAFEESTRLVTAALRCRPLAPRTVAMHDCVSLAAAWGLGEQYTQTSMLDGTTTKTIIEPREDLFDQGLYVCSRRGRHASIERHRRWHW
jgi:hypothetical protein